MKKCKDCGKRSTSAGRAARIAPSQNIIVVTDAPRSEDACEQTGFAGNAKLWLTLCWLGAALLAVL